LLSLANDCILSLMHLMYSDATATTKNSSEQFVEATVLL